MKTSSVILNIVIAVLLIGNTSWASFLHGGSDFGGGCGVYDDQGQFLALDILGLEDVEFRINPELAGETIASKPLSPGLQLINKNKLESFKLA